MTGSDESFSMVRWYASGDQVPIADRWIRHAAGFASNVDVAICGPWTGPRNALVQAQIFADVADGAKVIVLDSVDNHTNITKRAGVEHLPAAALEAFVDPAELISQALVDHDVVVVDLSPTLIDGVSWPPVDSAVPLLRVLLDAQRVAVPGRLVIVLDEATQIFDDDRLARLAKMCLAEPTGQVSHVLVCDTQLSGIRSGETIDLRIEAPSPSTYVGLAPTGEVFFLEVPQATSDDEI